MIYFGHGGTEAEIINDLAYGLPPLNMHLAREIMAQTRIYQRLRYTLLRRADLNALALTLVKVAQMVIDLDALAELEHQSAARRTPMGCWPWMRGCAGTAVAGHAGTAAGDPPLSEGS